MLRILDPHAPAHLSRRDWLRIGGLALAGWNGPRLSATPAAETARAKACIFFFLSGGPSQHDTWDPKPDAPVEIRGESSSSASAVPGLRIGDLMPLTAKLVRKICVLRAMSTDDNAHSSSGYWVQTGRPHLPKNQESAKPGAPNDSPSLGGILRHLNPRPGKIPCSVTLPERIINNPNIPWPGQDGGFLGRAADPWMLRCDPQLPSFRVPELTLPDELPALRFDERRALIDQVSQHLQYVEQSPALARDQLYRQQAFDLIASPQVRHAFDLDREAATTRDRYGRTKVGQSLLLARRLIEAGVKYVHVNWPREPGDTNTNNPLWDTHLNHAKRMKDVLMPQMDQGYSALLEDLEQRGMLDETLVAWTGEFGRSPRLNGSAGRDHWGHVFSAALAGGGIRGGQAIGSSDSIGGHPRDGRLEPQDLHATILHQLGYSPDTQMRDVQGRPMAICTGTPIAGAI